MSVWGNEFKGAAKPKAAPTKRGPIPIQSLNRIGCSVCPNDKPEVVKLLRSPKMAPEGDEAALVYVLAMRPTARDDETGQSFGFDAGKEVMRKLHRNAPGLFDRSRNGYIVQCAATGEHDKPSEHETECCRGRVEADIEATKPLIVVGVGDEVLHWATGLPRAALTFRGTPIAARFGKHVCWFVAVASPNYLQRRDPEPSEYELLLGHDLAELEALVDRPPPTFCTAPFDAGIECITGEAEGDMRRLEEAFHAMLYERLVGLDIETNMLRPFQASAVPPALLCAAVGTFERTVAFSIDHPHGWGTETRMKRVHGLFGEFLSQSGPKVCHNVGFEQEWLAWFYGPQLLRRTEWHDTMAMAYGDDERKGTKGLDEQCRIHYGFFLKDQSRVDVSRREWWLEHSLRAVLRYNGMDTKWTHRLARDRLPEILADPRRASVYDTNVRLAPALVLLTDRGLPVNMRYAEDLEDGFTKTLDRVEAELRKLPEVRTFIAQFGSYSPTNEQHTLKIMRDILGRPEVQVSKRGVEKDSVDEEVLLDLADKGIKSAKLQLEFRGANRNKTTYLAPVTSGKLIARDGRIHAGYRRDTVTGRLSSEMHNWPKHKHIEVRGCVQSEEEEDEWLVAADYGQIEFRVAGMLSHDSEIVRASWTKYDVHKFWAERTLALEPEWQDFLIDEYSDSKKGWAWEKDGLKAARQHAKNGWVFPMLFGAQAEGCAVRMHISREAAQRLADEFWDTFREHRRWQIKLVAGYRKHLYVETLGGFRRHGAMSVEELINMPIQGTAAEIVLEGMMALSERADAEERPELQPAFNGHDDLTFLLPDDRLESCIDDIALEMCKPRFDYINVPLIVEVSVGYRWDKLEEIAKYSSESLYGLVNPYTQEKT